MKQQVFEKSISELEFGDQIIVPGNELQPTLPAPFYEATVISKKQGRTFGYQAMLVINGLEDTILTTDLDLHHKFTLASLLGQDFVWVTVPNIEIGDRISWWQNAVPIQNIQQEGSTWYITVTDPLDGTQKRHKYKNTDALHVLIAEASKEKQQGRY